MTSDVLFWNRHIKNLWLVFFSSMILGLFPPVLFFISMLNLNSSEVSSLSEAYQRDCVLVFWQKTVLATCKNGQVKRTIQMLYIKNTSSLKIFMSKYFGIGHNKMFLFINLCEQMFHWAALVFMLVIGFFNYGGQFLKFLVTKMTTQCPGGYHWKLLFSWLWTSVLISDILKASILFSATGVILFNWASSQNSHLAHYKPREEN